MYRRVNFKNSNLASYRFADACIVYTRVRGTAGYELCFKGFVLASEGVCRWTNVLSSYYSLDSVTNVNKWKESFDTFNWKFLTNLQSSEKKFF